MLTKLYVKNYALIEELELSLHNGLSIITGETGAGKSILIGAFSLILGNRADLNKLLDPKLKCIVEGVFSIDHIDFFKDWFSEQELDYDEKTIIRREILPQGKSRAFINDTPVKLEVLKDLSKRLVDIHSQHETLFLNDASFQARVLDSFARQMDLLRFYQKKYKDFVSTKNELERLLEKEKQSISERDYLEFLHEELSQANIKEDELETIEKEMDLLEHTEEIQENLKAIKILYENDNIGIETQLGSIKSAAEKLARFDSKFSNLLDRFQNVQIELADILNEYEQTHDLFIVDNERSELIKSRYNLLNHLVQKHQVSNTSTLLTKQKEIAKQLEEIHSISDVILKKKHQYSEIKKSISEIAQKMTAQRIATKPILEKELVNMLKQLGLENSQIQIRIEKTPELQINGAERIALLFSANPGKYPEELSKIASGGELSRFMLAVKSITGHKNLIPTLVFDEIDMGVSGEIAIKVGNIMKVMSKNMQVITITHLPQIAAMADQHYHVYKNIEQQKTRTLIKKLNTDERITSIAKMIGGDDIKENAIASAKDLLKL